MKSFIFYFYLTLFCFSPYTHAQDIEDLEMEGLSIGESLLIYFDKKQIIENSKFIYANEKSFSKEIASIMYDKNLSEYESIQLDFKFNDPNFTIVGISGYISYENNLKGCYKKQKEIFNGLKNDFSEAKTFEGEIEEHPGYPKGEVKFRRFSFFLNENEYSNLEIICFEAINYTDRLSVSTKSAEFNEWMYKLNN